MLSKKSVRFSVKFLRIIIKYVKYESRFTPDFAQLGLRRTSSDFLPRSFRSQRNRASILS